MRPAAIDTPSTITVLIADDHAVVREGVRHVLEADPEVEIIAEASNGEEVLALAARHRPGVVLLDISMPRGNGLEVAARLRDELPDTRVVIMSVHDEREYVVQGLRAGAAGYLSKDSSPDELRAAIHAVHVGGTFFSAPVAEALTSPPKLEDDRDLRLSRLALLTTREREVLRGVADGATSKEIGDRLAISTRTVESHRESVMRKLEIRTVAGLTRFAIAMGLVRDD